MTAAGWVLATLRLLAVVGPLRRVTPMTASTGFVSGALALVAMISNSRDAVTGATLLAALGAGNLTAAFDHRWTITSPSWRCGGRAGPVGMCCGAGLPLVCIRAAGALPVGGFRTHGCSERAVLHGHAGGPLSRVSARGSSAGGRIGDVRVDRRLLPPSTPSLEPRDAVPARVRNPPHRRCPGGMITQPNLSGKPGQATFVGESMLARPGSSKSRTSTTTPGPALWMSKVRVTRTSLSRSSPIAPSSRSTLSSAWCAWWRSRRHRT